jgi:hypothetical protein
MKIDFGVIVVYTPLLWCFRYGKSKSHAEKQHFFTVDSNNSFEMDNASGRFCYIEDPDGTLIELDWNA